MTIETLPYFNYSPESIMDSIENYASELSIDDRVDEVAEKQLRSLVIYMSKLGQGADSKELFSDVVALFPQGEPCDDLVPYYKWDPSQFKSEKEFHLCKKDKKHHKSIAHKIVDFVKKHKKEILFGVAIVVATTIAAVIIANAIGAAAAAKAASAGAAAIGASLADDSSTPSKSKNIESPKSASMTTPVTPVSENSSKVLQLKSDIAEINDQYEKISANVTSDASGSANTRADQVINNRLSEKQKIERSYLETILKIPQEHAYNLPPLDSADSLLSFSNAKNESPQGASYGFASYRGKIPPHLQKLDMPWEEILEKGHAKMDHAFGRCLPIDFSSPQLRTDPSELPFLGLPSWMKSDEIISKNTYAANFNQTPSMISTTKTSIPSPSDTLSYAPPSATSSNEVPTTLERLCIKNEKVKEAFARRFPNADPRFRDYVAQLEYQEDSTLENKAIPPFGVVPLIGKAGRSTIDFHCGIGNGYDSTNEGGYCLHASLSTISEDLAIQPHWIHKDSLVCGLGAVLLEKLHQDIPQEKVDFPKLPIQVGIVTIPPPETMRNSLSIVAEASLKHSKIEAAITYEVEHLYYRAQQILEKNNPKLKQVHITFSNGGHVFQEALKRLPQEYQETIIVITAGTTSIIDEKLACEVYNVIGDKDWPSQLCNGVKTISNLSDNDSIKIIEQNETKPIIGGHYFMQENYQKEIKTIVQDKIMGNYEIH